MINKYDLIEKIGNTLTSLKKFSALTQEKIDEILTKIEDEKDSFAGYPLHDVGGQIEEEFGLSHDDTREVFKQFLLKGIEEGWLLDELY